MILIRQNLTNKEGIPLTGTLVNTGAILAGSLIGMTAEKHLPERLKTIAMHDLSCRSCWSACGWPSGAGFSVGHPLSPVGHPDRRTPPDRTGDRADRLVANETVWFRFYDLRPGIRRGLDPVPDRDDGHRRFDPGWCGGDASTLYIKSLLDGVASIALSSTLGVGVAFSALSVLIVQGTITLLASHLYF